jgi:hypothetical protein
MVTILQVILSFLASSTLMVIIGILVPLTKPIMHLQTPKNTKLRFESSPERAIKDVMLVGTHGSAAYRLDVGKLVDDRNVGMKRFGYLIQNYTRRWAINQRYSLYDQLTMGVRFLHLEISLYQDEWCTIHSYKAGTLTEDLLEILRFVTVSGSTHFTLLQPQLFGNQAMDTDSAGRTYMDAIDDTLGPYGRLYHPHDHVSTYYNRVAVLTSPPLHPRDSTDDVDVFLHNRDQVGPPGQFLQWVMTPDTKTIVRSMLLPFIVPGSLSDLYPTKHDHLLRYIQSHQPLRFQCIIIDFVDPTFVEIIDNIELG